MDRVARCFARRARELRSEERGAFLVETIVAAVLVAVIAVAMLSAFDGANQASGRTKMRAIAGSLAQTDQERMRSMPVSMLSGLIQTQTKTVNGVNYKVDSTTQWLADDSNNPNCTANGNAGDYMEITSSVSSPSQPALRAVVVKSIVTPAPGTLGVNQGSLAVTVVDRRGKGVPDLTVSINGPTSASDVTDQNGCAFFGYEPIGNYTVSAQRADWVDVMGRPTASATVSIASQQVSTKSLTYDLSGSANVTFVTDATDYPSTSVTRTNVPAMARRIRLTHNNMETPYVRDGAAPLGSNKWGDGNPQSSIVADSLFPFGDMTASPQLPSPYGVYAGDCDANNPNSQPNSPTGAGAQTVDPVQIEPGKATDAIVHLPALNVHASSNVTTVKVTLASAGCTATSWKFTASDLNAAGNLTSPGFPYGLYTVCADNGSRRISRSAGNYYRTGTAVVDLTVTGSSTLGIC
jgi:Tfp pilus assembly protein PilV